MLGQPNLKSMPGHRSWGRGGGPHDIDHITKPVPFGLWTVAACSTCSIHTNRKVCWTGWGHFIFCVTPVEKSTEPIEVITFILLYTSGKVYCPLRSSYLFCDTSRKVCWTGWGHFIYFVIQQRKVSRTGWGLFFLFCDILAERSAEQFESICYIFLFTSGKVCWTV